MQIATFLMFTGAAEEAISLYVALFPDSKIVSIQRYSAGEQGREGSVKTAHFELLGVRYMAFDSPVQHAFTFTPAISLFVDLETREQVDAAYARLSEGGQTLMPPASYGFSQHFAWVQDRFGVSWQLNLP